MARLPLPPPTSVLTTKFDAKQDLFYVGPDTSLYRIFTAKGNHQMRWNAFRAYGPMPHGRFDAHHPQRNGAPATNSDCGVIYFGTSMRVSIASVFQASSTVDRRTREPMLAVMRPRRTLCLLDLATTWTIKVGASLEICSGPKKLTQAWARAIRSAFPELDGVSYLESMAPLERAICLWDSPAAAALPAEPELLLPLHDPRLDEDLMTVCEDINYVLLN